MLEASSKALPTLFKTICVGVIIYLIYILFPYYTDASYYSTQQDFLNLISILIDYIFIIFKYSMYLFGTLSVLLFGLNILEKKTLKPLLEKNLDYVVIESLKNEEPKELSYVIELATKVKRNYDYSRISYFDVRNKICFDMNTISNMIFEFEKAHIILSESFEKEIVEYLEKGIKIGDTLDKESLYNTVEYNLNYGNMLFTGYRFDLDSSKYSEMAEKNINLETGYSNLIDNNLEQFLNTKHYLLEQFKLEFSNQ